MVEKTGQPNSLLTQNVETVWRQFYFAHPYPNSLHTPMQLLSLSCNYETSSFGSLMPSSDPHRKYYIEHSWHDDVVTAGLNDYSPGGGYGAEGTGSGP